ncbi:alpha/beta hydrolase [Cribrihabitans pelagius]|uniref:alpha/beta hydrolase n=1 Tax=Cribrihabitans pelagius TaxID=1765746 RepID=UPI003B596669
MFDGDRLRGSLFNPGQRRLFVSFRQRTREAGQFSDAAPVKAFAGAGYTHLHLQARLNDWYINEETAALEAALTEVTSGFAEAAAMGFSMGGYAALRFARALNLTRLIAVSPQFSIAPEHVPFDRRYRKYAGGFDPEQGALQGRGHPVMGAVLADPFRPADMVNAEMIQLVFPGLGIARLCAGGHPATQVLREGRRFPALQRLLRTPGPIPEQAVALHRRARRASPQYWRQLAEQACKSGRIRLAAEAGNRHTQLAQGKAPENTGI